MFQHLQLSALHAALNCLPADGNFRARIIRRPGQTGNNVDIPSDKPFEFLKRLSTAIYQMHDKTADYEDVKSFGGFLWSIFAGIDSVNGYRKHDIIQEMIDAI